MPENQQILIRRRDRDGRVKSMLCELADDGRLDALFKLGEPAAFEVALADDDVIARRNAEDDRGDGMGVREREARFEQE